MDIKRRVWRFRDGSSVEFDERTKEISARRGLALAAMRSIKHVMPEWMRLARDQDELDKFIIESLEGYLKATK